MLEEFIKVEDLKTYTQRANLKNKGLVEIYKKYTSIFRRKKKKFVKVKK